MTGTVYFIQSGVDGPVKVGFTNKLAQRMSSLQTAHPYPLRLLGSLPGSRDNERAAHDLLQVHREAGEWFSPAPEVLSALQEWLAAGRIPESSRAPRPTLNTPLRNFRIPDEEYQAAKDKAVSEGTNLTAVVRQKLREYLEGEDDE